jgi:hypothetical protein
MEQFFVGLVVMPLGKCETFAYPDGSLTCHAFVDGPVTRQMIESALDSLKDVGVSMMLRTTESTT